jgi:hypothetical protein
MGFIGLVGSLVITFSIFFFMIMYFRISIFYYYYFSIFFTLTKVIPSI